jgi:hypothetical protein
MSTQRKQKQKKRYRDRRTWKSKQESKHAMRSHPNPASMEGLSVEHCAFLVAQHGLYAAWLALKFREAWNSRPQLRQTVRKYTRPEIEVLGWMMNAHNKTPNLEKLAYLLKAVVSQFSFWSHERRCARAKSYPSSSTLKGTLS